MVELRSSTRYLNGLDFILHLKMLLKKIIFYILAMRVEIVFG